MDLRLSEDQLSFREVVREFMEKRSQESDVRRCMAGDTGWDADVWRQLTQQLGLGGLTIDTALGGLGLGQVELSVVLEEMGVALFCSPFFATVAFGVNVLQQSGDDSACRRYLPEVAEGTLRLAVAHVEADGDWNPEAATTQASLGDDGWEITGSKSFVIDGHTAQLLLVTAQTHAGLGVFAVSGTAQGLTRTGVETMDQTRRQAEITLARVPAALVGELGAGAAVMRRALDRVVVSLAAEQVGGAQRCLTMAVDYAKIRYQFGRPIGSFQSIKHKCADVLIDVESARSVALYAAWCIDSDDADGPLAASTAKSYCSEAYFRAAAANIQIHGGIGFTWEHGAHLYFKRAKSSEVMFGTPAQHRIQLAERAGFAVPSSLSAPSAAVAAVAAGTFG